MQRILQIVQKIPLGAGGAGPLNFVLIGSKAILQTEFTPVREEWYACKDNNIISETSFLEAHWKSIW